MLGINLRNAVSELYAKYQFRASPVLDQYFLVNEGVIERLIRYADVNKNDTVLEIGPGLGFITKQLAEKAGKVIAVEYDRKLEKLLSQELKDYDNVELIFGDVLKAEIPKFNKIVSNIPFQISAPLTFRLLDFDFETAVLFFQKEFGEKMTTEPGLHDYGRLSVMAQYYFNVEKKEIVPRNYFYPQPKTDSVVIQLNKKNVERDESFDAFVREIFRYKNKNVSNSVKMGVGKEVDDVRKTDSLTVEEVRALYNSLK